MGIIIILIIIMLIIKFNGAKIKGNVGEKRVANILSTLDNTKYKVINNLMIRTERGTTQIDHVVISIYGVFVIETKNYKGIIKGNELLVGIVSSQIISNVPAAMLLSGFTTDYKQLLYGVNIGGLGTLIASMASLISYRFYARTYQEQKGRYFRVFTIYNVVLLVLLYVVACI